MASEDTIRRYRNWYTKLLRLYSKPYQERFGAEMEQTFNDLLRERAAEGRGLFGFTLWIFGETAVGIVKENAATLITQNKRAIGITLAPALVLLVPLIAMQFSDEVNWTLSDFVIASILLHGASFGYMIATRISGSIAYRAAVGLAIMAGLLLVWINLAVGIIGSEDNPANLMYLLVPLLGIIGAFIVRFRPLGMARVGIVTAAAQASVPVIAIMIGRPQIRTAEAFMGVVGVFVLSWFFAALFLGSAWLFRRSIATDSNEKLVA